MAQDSDIANDSSQEELAHQFAAMQRFETERRVLAIIPFLLSAVWLPFWLCLALLAANFLTELIGFSTLRRLVANRNRVGYRTALAAYALSQLFYLIVPAMVWQFDDPMAKAVALGISMVNLIHIATIRSVHMPLAMTNLATATLVSLGAIVWYWEQEASWSLLMLSTFCLLALTYFVLLTLGIVHRLYRDLARDRRAAEVANEAKSRFLAQMSHELRTPLQAILGLGIVEQAQAENPESRDRLASVVQSARGLSVLLDDILDLSAVEAGTLPIRPGAVALEPEIRATLALFGRQIAEAGQELSASFEDLPPVVWLDRQRMRQCLSNLLSNAIKYAGAGQLTLRVSLGAPGQLMIDLSDQGKGVPLDQREQIFEPFARGAEAALVPGIGLGLAVSRKLAQRMGGDLVLLPGEKGAHFRLTLAVELPPDIALPPEGERPALADLHGKCVLVVDDIATNRLVAMSYLRMMGATSLECDSGAAALRLLAGQAVDLVLMDLVMPDMDGMETLQAIRALGPSQAALPVIAMTADVSEDRRAACRSAGLAAYVSKPMTPEALSDAISQALAA